MRSLLSTARWLLLSKMASPCSMDPPGIAGQSFTTTLQSPCLLVTARAQWHNQVKQLWYMAFDRIAATQSHMYGKHIRLKQAPTWCVKRLKLTACTLGTTQLSLCKLSCFFLVLQLVSRTVAVNWRQNWLFLFFLPAQLVSRVTTHTCQHCVMGLCAVHQHPGAGGKSLGPQHGSVQPVLAPRWPC